MRTSLVVTPTDETIRRVRAIVESTVLELDTDLMHIEIAGSESAPAPAWAQMPDTTYADVKVKDVIVDTQIATNGAISRLVAVCESQLLNDRRKMLGLPPAPGFTWILKYDVPPGRSARLVITTLIDVLVFREGPFSFSDEMLLQA
jgi:hypothetical protein